MKNIIAVIIVIASIGVFYSIIDPMYTEIQGLKLSKADYDQVLNNSKEATAVKDTINTKYNGIADADREKLLGILPKSIDNIRLIIEINKIASQYNMILKNAEVTQTPEGSPMTSGSSISPITSEYGVGKLTFSVSGSYSAYVSFIKDLEQSLRLLDITSISFIRVDQTAADTGPEVYEYKTSLNTYWYKS